MSDSAKRPVARPVDGAPRRSLAPGRGAERSERAADIPPSHSSAQSSRTSHSQLQFISDHLTSKDREILEFLEKFRLATGQQLQRHFHGDGPAEGRAARRQLLRLTKIDALQRLERRVGGAKSGSSGFIYTLGLVGQRALNSERRPRRHQERAWPFQAHTVAITETYLQLSRHASDGFRLVRFDPEPHSWRTQTTGFGDPIHLRPDAFAVLDNPASKRRQYWFIEVDLDTESSSVIHRKMRRYLNWFETGIEQQLYGTFPRVHWHANSERRRGQIQAIAEQQPGPAQLHSTDLLTSQLAQTREPP